MDEMTENIFKLKEYSGEDEVVTSTEMKILLENVPRRKSFPSGIFQLDKLIDGFRAGELIAISGPRKHGKTLLCQTFTRTFANDGKKCLWFSYELGPKEFLDCFESVHGIDIPGFLMPRKNVLNDILWLQDRIFESIGKYGADVVFIDNLHSLFDLARMRNTSLEIGSVIRILKKLAVDLNITIFILCHMKKPERGREVDDGDFRDSSLIASESDTGLVIWRHKDDPKAGKFGLATLKVCYCRKTGAWDEKIKMVKVDGSLKERALNYDNI